MDTYMGLDDTTYLFTSDDVERIKTKDPEIYSSFTEADSSKDLAREYGLAIPSDLSQLIYEVVNQYHIHGGNLRVNMAPYSDHPMAE